MSGNTAYESSVQPFSILTSVIMCLLPGFNICCFGIHLEYIVHKDDQYTRFSFGVP